MRSRIITVGKSDVKERKAERRRFGKIIDKHISRLEEAERDPVLKRNRLTGELAFYK